MISKKSSKKISFLLAASLLTAAVPATTQAGWKKGVGFTGAGILAGALTYPAGSTFLNKTLWLAANKRSPKFWRFKLPVLSQNKKDSTKNQQIASGLTTLMLGGVFLFCIKKAYDNFFGKKSENVGIHTDDSATWLRNKHDYTIKSTN